MKIGLTFCHYRTSSPGPHYITWAYIVPIKALGWLYECVSIYVLSAQRPQGECKRNMYACMLYIMSRGLRATIAECIHVYYHICHVCRGHRVTVGVSAHTYLLCTNTMYIEDKGRL
jgi:hypothetical protein